ncbi:hypothetical protein CDES_00170 [Corynebacterium deserti GIMN1.010]|uniref:RidA family protein n=1 Tax=Corynebacterium deserti GIMN1.010 TaxID=931089 RepID=A0A0M4CGB6_9CORY|nr:RidA family protein [Corynebacterium deserti]ALC04521.1 hypothetical protein CDES_00170 [Corynebacterium deserti GIMN1.010]
MKNIELINFDTLIPPSGHGKVLSNLPFKEQALQVLENLDYCLIATRSRRDQLLSVTIYVTIYVTVYVTDMQDWPAFDAPYLGWIGDHRPGRAVVGSSELHYGAQVEIEAIAISRP